ncbi:hypothetical protein [uncultured Anaerovibrio sp.]|uniref:hypothetical protein n=1 Tax=uncultured Anaerovibrio sp. TaxID=361586 RepID=UPI0025E6D835|nr:hypothetical protein [uncultured Anaerovibrio sp.]
MVKSKIIIGVLLILLIALSAVCYAASTRWYCPNCGTKLEYYEPVDYPKAKDMGAVGPCYDMFGRQRMHDWKPY